MENCIMISPSVHGGCPVDNNSVDAIASLSHVPSLKQVTIQIVCSVSFPSIQDLSLFSDTEILCVRWASSQMYHDRSLALLCEWLQRLPKLKRLEIENYRVHGHFALFFTLANCCRELESLSLQGFGAHVGRIRVVEERQAWGEMLKLPHLRELSLFGINFATGDFFDVLQDSALEVFTCWRCRVYRESGNLWKVVARCRTIRTLQFHHLDQRPVRTTALPPNLISLHLSCITLSRETCQFIQDHAKLRQIRLTGCTVFDDHRLPFNPQWESYGLYHTHIEALPAAYSFSSLHTLEFVDCNLDDQKLDVSLFPMRLKCLNLSHNAEISTNWFGKLLSKCTDLECLHIAGMNIDVAGISAAVAAHYKLTDIVTDEEIPGNVETYLRLNQAGRRYLQSNEQMSSSMSAKVLGEVSCHLNDIYTHLLETPSICSFLEKL